MTRSLKAAIIAGSVTVAAQFVQFARTNPPVGSDLAAPDQVEVVLRGACYDCHSNETRWPWYGAIAPVSWLMHRDVAEGRRRLNFSQWAEYASDPGTVSQKLAKISQFVASGDMAPWYYRILHPDARLAPAQRTALIAWVQQETARRMSPH
jgi:hypothetical protein